MFDLSEVNLDALFCLFKGEPGTRKSTCALSFPRPQYWFSWDKKMESLLLPMMQWGINPQDIKADDYWDWDKPIKKLKDLQVTCPFRTIVIDSITTAVDSINRQTINFKASTGDKGGKVGTIYVNSIEDYKAEESAIGELLSLLKDIRAFHKVNVIIIAHVIQKEMKSPDGKTHMARLLFTAAKGSAQKIPAVCPEAYHFNIKKSVDVTREGTYALLTTHTGDDFARTSLPIPPEIEFGNEPLYDKWLKPAIEKLKKAQQQTPTTPTTEGPKNATSSILQA